MTEHDMLTGGKPPRAPRRARAAPPDRLTRRLLRQLAAALALFALWAALNQGPRADTRREALSRLLTGTQELWSACRQLGADLSQGASPAAALEEWCVQVFLPDSLSTPCSGDDGAAGQTPD